jgi:hypothetical protein
VNREDIVAVAARLFAIYLVVLALQFVVSSVSLNYQEAGTVSTLLVVAVTVTVAAIAAYLWLFPLTVARGLLPVMKDRDDSQPLTMSIAFGLGLALLGVWLFCRSLTDLVYFSALWAMTNASDGSIVNIGPGQYAALASAVVRFALSIFLMFGSSGIRRSFLRLRYGNSGGGF